MSRDFKFESEEYTLKFGNFTLDLDTQTLSTTNTSVRLRSKLCLVLEFLVKNKNRLIAREELIEHIWKGNTYTGQQAVTHSICHLRKLLTSLGDGTALIDTIPKRGYRFYVRQDDDDNYSNGLKFSNSEPKVQLSSSVSSFMYSSEGDYIQQFKVNFL